MAKVENLKSSKTFDLSLEEDLSLAVMNLISLEEHFFMTSQKTGDDKYLDLLSQTRELRKVLLGRMIPAHEGETWCISKHLLATTMRLLEVGTKLQTDNKPKEAKDFFSHAYKVYSMFWAIRLKLTGLRDLKPAVKNEQWTLQDITTKLVDCCKE